MQGYLTLTRRELGAFFVSITGYVIIAAAAFLMGLSFVDLLAQLKEDPTPVPVTQLFFATPYFWLILLLGAPVITMRLFSLEKASGTYETLMTAPVGDLQVVLAKFTAAMVFYLLMWLPLLACILIVRHYTTQPVALDVGLLVDTRYVVLLLSLAFIGLFLTLRALETRRWK